MDLHRIQGSAQECRMPQPLGDGMEGQVLWIRTALSNLVVLLIGPACRMYNDTLSVAISRRPDSNTMQSNEGLLLATPDVATKHVLAQGLKQRTRNQSAPAFDHNNDSRHHWADLKITSFLKPVST